MYTQSTISENDIQSSVCGSENFRMNPWLFLSSTTYKSIFFKNLLHITCHHVFGWMLQFMWTPHIYGIMMCFKAYESAVIPGNERKWRDIRNLPETGDCSGLTLPDTHNNCIPAPCSGDHYSAAGHPSEWPTEHPVYHEWSVMIAQNVHDYCLLLVSVP